jgi:hypothetical protein
MIREELDILRAKANLFRLSVSLPAALSFLKFNPSFGPSLLYERTVRFEKEACEFCFHTTHGRINPLMTPLQN